MSPHVRRAPRPLKGPGFDSTSPQVGRDPRPPAPGAASPPGGSSSNTAPQGSAPDAGAGGSRSMSRLSRKDRKSAASRSADQCGAIGGRSTETAGQKATRSPGVLEGAAGDPGLGRLRGVEGRQPPPARRRRQKRAHPRGDAFGRAPSGAEGEPGRLGHCRVTTGIPRRRIGRRLPRRVQTVAHSGLSQGGSKRRGGRMPDSGGSAVWATPGTRPAGRKPDNGRSTPPTTEDRLMGSWDQIRRTLFPTVGLTTNCPGGRPPAPGRAGWLSTAGVRMGPPGPGWIRRRHRPAGGTERRRPRTPAGGPTDMLATPTPGKRDSGAGTRWGHRYMATGMSGLPGGAVNKNAVKIEILESTEI